MIKIYRFLALFFVLSVLLGCYSSADKRRLNRIISDPRYNRDSVLESLDVARKVWNNSPWSKDYEYADFLDYVLPSQIADEPVEYYWRTAIPQWIEVSEFVKEGILDIACEINARIDVETRPEDWKNPQMGYSATMTGKFGKCDDRAILCVMAMRSMGIPSAFDFIPMWGGGNNGHSFCSVISPSDSVYVFQSKNDNGTDIIFANKVAKIYRKHCSLEEDELLSTLAGKDYSPMLFFNGDVIDVTSYHKVGSTDVRIQVLYPSCDEILYLAVFHPNGWYPIAPGNAKNGECVFRAIGNGIGFNGELSLKGDHIGNGILYLPCSFDGKIHPVNHPIIVSKDSIRFLKPQAETEVVTLNRKYPKLLRVEKFAGTMIGGVIEGANNEDFSDAEVIEYIYNVPASHPQKFSTKHNYRFFRFRKHTGTLSISEFSVFDNKGNKIICHPVVPNYLADLNGIDRVFDNDILTYFEISNISDCWIGVDLGPDNKANIISICPRTDDNDISPGDIYELFYWDNRWISLGLKEADDYQISFDNVPKGALLWLRNRTKGIEERPFTYENGNQIWW